DERPFSGYAEIHRRTPRERESAMLSRARGSAPPGTAQQGPEHAADDLATQRRPDRAGGALGHRLDRRVLAPAAGQHAAERILQRAADATAGRLTARRAPGAAAGRGGRRAPLEH